MEAPVYKIEFEYINPTDIESEVPNHQNLREGDETAIQDSTLELDNKVENPEDYVLSPVITVTKQESELTKGDLKLQKISVTENISIDTNGAVYYTINSNPNIHSEVIKGPQPVRVAEDDGRTRTRIPTLRFRQAAQAVRERRESIDKKDEVPPPRLTQKRSSIPRLKDSKIPLEKRNSKSDIKVETLQPEDEFDKIYDEVIVNEPKETVNETPESIKIEDPEKLEHEFEDIIHDYEENKVHPITEDLLVSVEKPKYSKIPLSKRNSDQDIKIPKIAERNTNKKHEQKPDKVETRIPVHKNMPPAVNTKHTFNRTDDKPNNVNSNEITVNKSATLDKSQEADLKPKFVHAESVETPKKEIMNVHDINPHNIKEDHVNDHDENDVINVNPELIPVNTVLVDEPTTCYETKHVSENTNCEIGETNITIPMKDQNTDLKEDNNNMDVEYKPGKVSRLLQKLRSRELETNGIEPKKEIFIDIPKKKSISSKIAMFERQESEEVSKPRPPYTKPPQTNPKEFKSMISNERIVDRTPIIVDQLLKQVAIDTAEPDVTVEFSPSEHLYNNINKETKKYKQIQVIDPVESITAIEGQTVSNENVLDISPKVEVETQIEIKEYSDPQSITNIVEMTEPISKEFLMPPVQNIDETNPTENDAKTLNNKPEECENQIPINLEDNSIKEDIPTENIAIHEIKIQTVEFKSIHKKFESVDDVFTKESKVEKWRGLNEKGEFKQERAINVLEISPKEEVETQKGNKDYSDPQSVTNIVEMREPISREFLMPPVQNIDETSPTENYTKTLNNKPEEYEIQTPMNLEENFIKEDILTENITIQEIKIRTEELKLIHNKFEIVDDVFTKESKVEKWRRLNEKGELKQAREINVLEISPKEEVETQKENKDYSDPQSITNIVEMRETVSRDFLMPPVQNIDVTNPTENYTKTLDNKPEECEIQTPINLEQKSIKEDIPTENTAIQEVKIQTVEFKPIHKKFESADDVFTKESKVEKWRRLNEKGEFKQERAISVVEIDLGDAVKGKVNQMIVRMNSVEKIENNKKEIDPRERPRKKSVSKIIALFEQKSVRSESPTTLKTVTKPTIQSVTLSDEEYNRKVAELATAKVVYGRAENMTYIVLNDGVEMPVLAVGTALLDKRLVRPVIEAAIDMGYRAIDTAYIYGNEKEVGEAIRAKIEDGTVRREDLFVISKLWNTFHRTDLVSKACKDSLAAMGLKYFDLYLIHNPVSFKEGSDPIPKIANVVQYSSSDFMDAWYGMEGLVSKGLVRSIGVSNFNSQQVQRVLDKARVKPVINQVECHPYLSQERLGEFCSIHDVKLSCFGVLGSKGTPVELTSGLSPVIDDPMVKVMAAGLNITAAQLLIRYQIDSGHNVVVKASSAAHLWENLQSLLISLEPAQVKALTALNRNKRIFTFQGFGDTHRNYPFRIQF